MNKIKWLKSIQEGKSKEIAKIVFCGFTTQERVSRILYKNRKKYGKGKLKNKKIIHYVEPIVNRNFKLWEKEGFLEKSRPLKIEHINRWGNQQHKIVYWNILNLEPFYRYCKELKHVNFNDEEKDFLKLFLLPFREEIIKENPEEDLISAILKFYAKHFIMIYFKALRELREFPEKHKENFQKAKNLNDPDHPMKRWHDKIEKDIEKKYGKRKTKRKGWDAMRVFSYSSENISNSFIHYFNRLESNLELVQSIDNKILKALGIDPIINKKLSKKNQNP
jgi:hypothetical protein